MTDLNSHADDNAPVILVSGANRGIGKAIAEELIQHGYRLSLGSRDPAALDAAFPQLDEHHHCHHFDALDHDSARAWVDGAVAHYGRIDGLVNNAGMHAPVRLRDDEEAQLDQLWAVNVKAPLRLTRLCLPHLEKTGRGRIINLASLSGKRAPNDMVGYNMTKFALVGLTHSTRQAAWDQGVRATAVCPGFVRTDMSAHTDKIGPGDMTQPATLAHLVRTLIELPNNAAIAELAVNCRLEDTL